MAELLDQILVEEIARYCPQKFLNYHKCISENHENPANCIPNQIELSNCIKNEIPSFKRILTTCNSLLEDYSNCLAKNPSNQQICADKIDQVRKCAGDCIDFKEPLNNLSVKDN